MFEIKNILFLVLISLSITSNINSQPYIYFTENVVDTIGGRLAYDVQKLNLNTRIKSQFLAYAGNVDMIKWDQTQTWLVIGNYNTPNYAINCIDTTIGFYLPIDIGGIGAILYSENNGRLYIFSSKINSNEAAISVFDLSTQQRIHHSIIPYRNEKYNVLNEEAFFSQNKDFIYFSVKDSLSGENKVMKLSASSFEITEEKILAELGYPSADGYILHRGINGKGIIKSFFRNIDKEQYYNIVDFDSDSSSTFIYSQGFFNPYLLSFGKYFVLEEILIDSTYSRFYSSGEINIYKSGDGSLAATFQVEPRSKLFLFDSYPNDLYFYVDSTNEAYSINIDSIVNPHLLVTLTNSQGTLLTTGSLKYYDAGWKDVIDNGDGTFTVITERPTVSLRMTYEYGKQTVHNVLAQDTTYTFQTVNAAVELRNSLGNLIDEGTVKYYAGGWREFGTTVNGIVNKELLPINYSFRMTYEYGSIDKQQDLSTDPTVVFQTVNAAVELRNSIGNLIDEGTVQYYAGAWRSFGTTVNGIANKELLPKNYSFRMTYEYGSIDKQQNLSTDPNVVFQTVNAALELRNSLGNLIDEGTVQYYVGAWRSFGTTQNGVANKELLPKNYSFRMSYEYVSNDKQQDLSTNSTVTFSTVLCTVKVSDTNNQPLENAEIKYYSGAWRYIGLTNTEGITTKELLPKTLSFRAIYGSVSQDKQQDIGLNNLVEFILNIP